MSGFQSDLNGKAAAFDHASPRDGELLSKLTRKLADIDKRAGEGDYRALHQELASTKSLLRAAEASKSEMLGLLHSLSQAANNEMQTEHFHEISAEADQHLTALHRAFSKIVRSGLGKTDVFTSHLLSEIKKIAAVAVEAANNGVLRVSEHQFSNAKSLLDAFGASERVLRYTWRINASESLFGEAHWRRHFELTSSLAISRAIKEIRAVLLVENRSCLDALHARKLLEFLASHDGLNAKILLAADYAACAADHAIPQACLDFGIYGDRLLYQADAYIPVSVGSWSNDAIEIARFCKFFDALWNSHMIAANNPVSPSSRVSLSQLMAADQAAGLRPNGVSQGESERAAGTR
jgi:hypothetical protein